jgi:hypothetical protein
VQERPANLSLLDPDRLACGGSGDVCLEIARQRQAEARRLFQHNVGVIRDLEWELFWAYTGGKVVRAGVGVFRAWRLTRAIVAARDGAVVGKTLFQTVGQDAGKLVQEALKGRTPLSALTAQQRGAAAAYYRDVATRTVGSKAADASRYNVARAEFLEGGRTVLSPTLPEFIANGF